MKCPTCEGAGELLDVQGTEGKPCDQCKGMAEVPDDDDLKDILEAEDEEDAEGDPDAHAKYERDEIFLLEE